MTMELGQVQSYRLELRQSLRPPTLTDSVFPKAEEVINSSSWLQGRLKRLGDAREMDKYRSRMDWLLVQVLPDWKPAVFRYYAGRGRQLRCTVSTDQLAIIERKLLVAIRLLIGAPADAYLVQWDEIRAHAKVAA